MHVKKNVNSYGSVTGNVEFEFPSIVCVGGYFLPRPHKGLAMNQFQPSLSGILQMKNKYKYLNYEYKIIIKEEVWGYEKKQTPMLTSMLHLGHGKTKVRVLL